MPGRPGPPIREMAKGEAEQFVPNRFLFLVYVITNIQSKFADPILGTAM
jgi:hypothetical protein